MLIYFTTKIICSTAAFLYPGYASYKTLSQRPASEADLERWLMYWSVLGCIVGVEYVAEWLVSWLPLYYPIKTLFLLYLCLPQTQGSSYLYVNHLQPFFNYYERDIDATLSKLKTRCYVFMQEKLRMLWDQVMVSLGHVAEPSAGADAAQPPTMADPASGPAQLLGGLWRTYGPTVVASGAALLRQSAQTSAAGGTALMNQFTSSAADNGGAQSSSLADRRRQLEAELASLPAGSHSPHSSSSGSPNSAPETSIPIQHGSTAYSHITPSASEADLRARVSQFEEVEVPSDVEGYSVGPVPGSKNASHNRASWFGWGGPSPPGADKGAKDD